MQRFGFVVTAAALTVFGVSGCATKNYVKNQTAPLVNHAGQLDQKTAQNSREIQDVNQRAQAGIQKAQGSAEQAAQSAQNAANQANQAQTAANDVAHRADSLESVVKGLDNYKQMADVTVTFGFDKSNLTADAKQQLDNFASQISNAQSYILEVTGGTDTTGPAQYNYMLSQRRADSVVQYLAAKYNIPPHRFYLIGIGKDQQVAPDNTAAGRKKNRRVEVQLLTNMSQGGGEAQPQSSAPSNPGAAQ
ncbi:MAG: OmpA family protein [Acidobacteriota bacterium]